MEIVLEQKYKINGSVFVVKDIRVTNILAPDDFKVAILFEPMDKNENAFQARAQEVLEDSAYCLVN